VSLLRKTGVEVREILNFLLICEFAEELQCSANLLSTVAPHHFVEPTANDFWVFGSTIEPKDSIVEPTVNALNRAK
jgi:hypothetical protein